MDQMRIKEQGQTKDLLMVGKGTRNKYGTRNDNKKDGSRIQQ